MELELSEEAKRFIDESVRSGAYGSVREMLEAGIARLMLDPPPPEIDDETLAEIDEGIAQIERGETVPWHEVRAELMAKYPPKGRNDASDLPR